MDNDEELILEILSLIKQNKKYKTIYDLIVRKEIEAYLNSHQKILKHGLKKSIIRKIVKEIRARLHRLYSSYQTKKKNKRDILLNELKEVINKLRSKKNKQVEQEHDEQRFSPPSLEIIDINNKQIKSKQEILSQSLEQSSQMQEQEYSSHFLYNNEILEITNKLLSTNISTKERLNDYKFIYNKIFSITGKPKIVVDLGAGLNPLSFPFMDLKKLIYYAYDIDVNDINFINNYFKLMRVFELRGKADVLDVRELTKINKINQLPNSDIIFIFKLIDLIDTKNKKKKKISEEIITYLLKNKKTKFIVVSFSTKTLSQKLMKLPIRRGFELMLLRNNLKFKTFSTSNEVFYVVWSFSK